MSASCTIDIANFPALCFTNHFPYCVHYIFNIESDCHKIDHGILEDDEIYLECTVKEARERFAIKKCVIFEEAKKEFDFYKYDAFDYRRYLKNYIDEDRDYEHFNRHINFEGWLKAFYKILSFSNKHFGKAFDQDEFSKLYKATYKNLTKIEKVILDTFEFNKCFDTNFGVPYKFNEFYYLKALLEIADDDWIIRCDLSDIINSGYGSYDDLSNDTSEKAIVLCEGTSDISFLEDVFNLIRPKYKNCFYFTKEHEFNSGCSNLSQYLVVFNEIHIKENVIGIFDNDTEGNKQYNLAIKKVHSPNIKIVKLPFLDEFSNYPYITVDNKIGYCNIDSKAVSIELFYPDTVLKCGNQYCPIMWSNYDKTENAYQGKVSKKEELQKRWEKEIKVIKKSGLKYSKDNYHRAIMLINYIISAFDKEERQGWLRALQN